MMTKGHEDLFDYRMKLVSGELEDKDNVISAEIRLELNYIAN